MARSPRGYEGFPGKVGRTREECEPYWERPLRPASGAHPNSTWPTYRGFERFYGFLEGETSYFYPARILYNNVLVPID